jgi:hypothetical protein
MPPSKNDDRLIDSPPDSSTLAGFPVYVARLPPAPLSILEGEVNAGASHAEVVIPAIDNVPGEIR